MRGSASYQVRLWIGDEEAAWACTCPVGREERFCKHAVAVGLVATRSVEPERGDGNAEEVNLVDYLTDLDREALVDLLLERAAADGLFDARLRAAAASKSGGRPDLKSYRQATRRCVRDRWLRRLPRGVRLHDRHRVCAQRTAASPRRGAFRGRVGAERVRRRSGRRSAGLHRRLRPAGCRWWPNSFGTCTSPPAEEARPEPITLARNLFDARASRRRPGGVLRRGGSSTPMCSETSAWRSTGGCAQAEWDVLSPLGPGDAEHTWSSAAFTLPRSCSPSRTCLATSTRSWRCWHTTSRRPTSSSRSRMPCKARHVTTRRSTGL